MRGCITESLLETFKMEAETISKFNPLHKKETQLSIKLLIKMFEDEIVECKSVQQKVEASTRRK
jgi:hypothetical protein